MQGSNIYRARVRNQAKLAYNSVAAWLEGKGPMPAAVAAVPGLAENLRLQDRVAQQLKGLRHEHGALELQTLEARPVFAGDEIRDLQADEPNRAKEIIEDFMIAANGVTARFLHGKKVASLRAHGPLAQALGTIVEIAAQHKFKLPGAAGFEVARRVSGRAENRRPAPLSRSVACRHQLLGPGEYVVEAPDEAAPGHSAWPSRITRTQRLPTGGFLI